MDNDYHEADFSGWERFQPYEERRYRCTACGVTRTGYEVIEESPPEFVLQPHQLYPMNEADFERWLAVVRSHFPDYPLLQEVGTSWYPGPPRDGD